MSDFQEKIHFTGMGAITPAGITFSPLFQACLENQVLTNLGIAKITKEIEELAIKKIKNSKWIKNPRPTYSRTLLFCLVSIIEAIDQAGWENLSNDDLVIIGTTTGQISEWEMPWIEFNKQANPQQANSQQLKKQILDSVSMDLKNILNFTGRALILASACSASTQAIALAERFLSSNRAKRCIAGGVEELSILTSQGFNCLKLLVTSPCMPFDKNRNGINLSEGAAFFCLEKNRPKASLGILHGGETRLDSYHMTSPDPKGSALQNAILTTLANAQVQVDQLSLVHAHGTASEFNDRAEANVMTHLLSKSTPVISTKGVHGHALGASGAIEIGLSLLMLIEQKILGTTGLNNPTEEATHLNLPKTCISAPVNYILKTTLGFGGINSVVLLGREQNA
jgi:3-oxoacyl-(acyl-carrier-protein) synthase